MRVAEELNRPWPPAIGRAGEACMAYGERAATRATKQRVERGSFSIMKIKDMPGVDRPREKLEKYGPERLSDAELLAVLLRTGGRGLNAVELAATVFKNFSVEKLPNASIADLEKTTGLGAVKAMEIVACFELGRRALHHKKSSLILSPGDIWQELKDIRGHKKEHFVVFFLDARNQEIRREIISVGTLNANLVHPREVFEPAIAHSAAQIIVAHNHPSGNPEPSGEDRVITTRLRDAGKILGIEILDHVVVAREQFSSFKDCGYLS